jgi:hypothetical protein
LKLKNILSPIKWFKEEKVKNRRHPMTASGAATNINEPLRGCTGALVTGLTSAGGGNMVGQTMDLFVPYWQNVKVELVTPKKGYRYLAIGGMFNRPLAALNEKGVGNTEFFRMAMVAPYQGTDKPQGLTGEDLLRQSDSSKKFVEIWSEYVTKYGMEFPTGAGAHTIVDPKEGYLLEAANWVYNNPANHAIHGPMTDQVFAHANFFVTQRLKMVEAGIGMGYNRAKRMWQLLVDRQYDSCMTFARGISLSYLMSCFRDHGNTSPEDHRFSVLGVSEERDQYTICTHGLKGYSTYAYICVARPDHTDLLSCLWMTFGQPCISPYLPFYIGINTVPEAMRTNAAAKVFDALRLTIEYHPEYRDKITHYWKIFDIHTMEESTALEGKVAMLAADGKPVEARKLLTEFVASKCNEALSAASQILDEIKGLPRLT